MKKLSGLSHCHESLTFIRCNEISAQLKRLPKPVCVLLRKGSSSKFTALGMEILMKNSHFHQNCHPHRTLATIFPDHLVL